jgi:hypothetical protein
MKTKIKKLNVNKQTVANLEDAEVRAINGGILPSIPYTSLCGFTKPPMCGPTRDEVA